MSISRRSLFQFSAIGATALATPMLMQRAAEASDADASASLVGSKTFTFGDFEITVMSDGHRIVPNPQGIFGQEQTVETVEALLDENFLPTDRMQFNFAPTLVKSGSELILFDTGNGEGGREAGVGQTRAALTAAGYQPEDVTIVVITHMHGDHIGGLTEDGAPGFPNARYVTNATEYDFWSDSALIGTPAENSHKNFKAKVVPFADKMTFVNDGDSVVSGITAMAAFGHTPGHMIYRIESGGRQLVLAADTANHYVLSLKRPDWEVRFDMDKAAAAQTRKRVFDMIATDRVGFVGYHMPFPAIGFVEKLDTGYRFVPASYQFDI